MGSISKKICLTHKCAPGDIVCMTALPRDLQTTYPDKFEIHVATHCKTLWQNNPYVASINSVDRVPNGTTPVHLNYGQYIREANKEKMHFITAFHRDFSKKYGLEVPVLHPKGDLHVPAHQIKESPLSDRYWIVVPGHKTDFTTKAWSKKRWQELIYRLRDAGINLVQVGGAHASHINPVMDGVLDLVGQTNLRDALWLVQHCEGIICPITFFMHLAGAFDKPCVCVAGGREHWWWEAYVNVSGVDNFGPYCQPVKVPHRYLHTQGMLDCCRDRGCWKNKVKQTERDRSKSFCKLPVLDGHGQTIPECMKMITVDHVYEAVMSYYRNGELPPIGKPAEIVLPDAEAPPKKILAPKNIDLFAPPEQILGALTDVPKEPGVLELVKAFEGEQKEKKAARLGHGDAINHPLIGGKMTICVLMYGDYPDMHRACLGSILNTTSPAQREIRVATNQLCLKTRAWLDRLKEEGEIHTLIHNAENKKKYPAMRQLFWDEDNPITTKWIVWFDDDSIANRDPQWYNNLAAKIISEYPKKARMVGDLMFWSLNQAQLSWAQGRPWWRNRYLQTKQKVEAPNGQKIFFAAGGFWALETDAMREAMIPDPDIGHNGGDYMVGLQLWQQGYRTAAWNNRKKHVYTSSVPRRGLAEVHTGMPGWQPGGVPKKKGAAV